MQIRVRLRPVVLSVTAVALLVALAAQSVFADARDFTLVNNTSATLREVYVVPVGSADWDENILDSDTLDPGTSLDVTFPDDSAGQKQLVGVASDGSADGPQASVAASDCLYNIKVVGTTGEAGYMYGVDLCSTSTVTFSDSAPTQ